MKPTFKNIGLLTALVIGFTLGAAASYVSSDAHAQVREGSQRLPVPSGAQQSVAVLRGMASTLESIDARLARIEASLERRTNRSE